MLPLTVFCTLGPSGNCLTSPSDESDGSIFHKTQRVSVLGGVDFQSMPTFSATSEVKGTDIPLQPFS
jgi:predicted aconitase with swiveling domain